MTVTAWLIGQAVGAILVALAVRRVYHLRALALCYALNPIAFLFVPPMGVWDYNVAGSADLVMVLLCLHFYCWASKAASRLALISMAINFTMFLWYLWPHPRPVFMVAYYLYPGTIRALEFGQLAVLAFWTPPVQQGFHALRKAKGGEGWRRHFHLLDLI